MIRRLFAALLAACLAQACASKTPEPAPAPLAAAAASRPVVIDPSASPISAAAQREVIRRQEAMRRADEAALRANRQMADGDYEAALQSSRNALGESR